MVDGRLQLGPGRGFWYDVVGESHYQGNLRRADAGRLELGEEVIVPCLVIAEPDNPYDPKAITVHIEDIGKVGYFARDDPRFGVLQAYLFLTQVAGICEGRLTGGWSSDVHIGIRLSLRKPELLLEPLGNDEAEPEKFPVCITDWMTRRRIQLPAGKRYVPLVEEHRCQPELRRLAGGRDVDAETVVFDALLIPEGDQGVVCAIDGGVVGRLSNPALNKYGPVLTALLRANAVGACGGWIVRERDGLGVKLSLGMPADTIKVFSDVDQAPGPLDVRPGGIRYPGSDDAG